MRIVFWGLAVLFTGCTATAPIALESRQQSETSTQPLPTTSGKFVGHYTVPTSLDLADAALFDVPEVEWSVSSGRVKLRYDLPVGLVGGDLSVTLSGPMPAGATTVQLTSSQGSGTCTASGTVVTCNEAFTNLGTLPISEEVVEQTALLEYDGPVTDRIAVASIFSSDPIGTVDFDVAVPAADDSGGGGGGGGNSGPH